ncbi:hypothetical protein [Paraburkholderia sediminicola]|uniref:hypothetical protein n=1 Tax=Paraburkholderia sediminicola TaxID=458836 RepID=UPI0038BD356D
MEIACAEKDGRGLTDYLISTTGRQNGYGSETSYKTVCGLTQDELEAVKMGTTVYFRAARGSLGSKKGTFWRKVLFYKSGRGTFAPRVPSESEVEMLRKKQGCSERVRLTAKAESGSVGPHMSPMAMETTWPW